MVAVREHILHMIVIRFGKRIYEITLIVIKSYLFTTIFLYINRSSMHYKYIKKNKRITSSFRLYPINIGHRWNYLKPSLYFLFLLLFLFSTR